MPSNRIAASAALAAAVSACSVISLDEYTRGKPVVPVEAGPTVTTVEDAGVDGASPYERAVLEDAPIAYYRFDEPADAGTVLSTIPGAAVGTLHGGQLGVPGVDHGALQLDGNGANVTFGNVFGFAGAQSYTIEIWFRADVYDGDYRRIWNRDVTDAKGRQGYTLYVNTAIGLGVERYIDDVLYFGHQQTVTVGKWTHAVATYDQSSMYLYVDGQVASSTVSPPTLAETSSPFVVGAAPALNGFFGGALDELAIYDKVLGDDRIKAHFALGAGH